MTSGLFLVPFMVSPTYPNVVLTTQLDIVSYWKGVDKAAIRLNCTNIEVRMERHTLLPRYVQSRNLMLSMTDDLPGTTIN